MSRKLKKLSHQYQFLKLELEEIDEELQEHDKEWASLFGRYFVEKSSEMWVNEETGEMRKEPPGTELDSKVKKDPKPDKIKKLYRKLSTFTHPDKGGDVDEFNDIKEYYQKNNLIELLKYASQFDLEYELEEEDHILLEKSCDKLRTHIRQKKATMAWQFGTGNRNQKLGVIRTLEAYLGKKIDRKDYPKDLLDD